MLEAISLAIGGYYGGTFGDILAKWEAAGVFSYILPFLLVFAIVFGLLDKLQIFKQKGVNAIIGLATALLSLQFGAVALFFSEIFPKMGIGLSIILVIIILLALLFPSKSFEKIRWPLIIVAIIVIAVVVISSLDSLGMLFGFYAGAWSFSYIPWNVVLIIAGTIGAIVWITGGIKKRKMPEAPRTNLDQSE